MNEVRNVEKADEHSVALAIGHTRSRSSEKQRDTGGGECGACDSRCRRTDSSQELTDTQRHRHVHDAGGDDQDAQKPRHPGAPPNGVTSGIDRRLRSRCRHAVPTRRRIVRAAEDVRVKRREA
jgi:hypothetical protein